MSEAVVLMGAVVFGNEKLEMENEKLSGYERRVVRRDGA
jgi:hypothetical protein